MRIHRCNVINKIWCKSLKVIDQCHLILWVKCHGIGRDQGWTTKRITIHKMIRGEPVEFFDSSLTLWIKQLTLKLVRCSNSSQLESYVNSFSMVLNKVSSDVLLPNLPFYPFSLILAFSWLFRIFLLTYSWIIVLVWPKSKVQNRSYFLKEI